MFGNSLKKIEKLAQKQNAEKLIEFVHDKHPQTRLAAIDALGQCKDEAAYNALIALVHDPDAGVRAHTILALKVMGDPKARVHIEHQKTLEKDADVLAAIHEALQTLHTRD